MTTNEIRTKEQRLRRALKKEGYQLQKSRKRNIDADNQGGYMVIITASNACAGGARYDWTLDDVERFISGN